MIKLHRILYRPLWPHFRVVRVRGEINQTSLVGFWLWWVFVLDLSGTRNARLNAIAQRSCREAYQFGALKRAEDNFIPGLN